MSEKPPVVRIPWYEYLGCLLVLLIPIFIFVYGLTSILRDLGWAPWP